MIFKNCVIKLFFRVEESPGDYKLVGAKIKFIQQKLIKLSGGLFVVY